MVREDKFDHTHTRSRAYVYSTKCERLNSFGVSTICILVASKGKLHHRALVFTRTSLVCHRKASEQGFFLDSDIVSSPLPPPQDMFNQEKYLRLVLVLLLIESLQLLHVPFITHVRVVDLQEGSTNGRRFTFPDALFCSVLF